MFVLQLRQSNPRRQGDIGEITAAEWLTRSGFGVWIPLCHSPSIDLIAQRDENLFRVQVKTATVFRDERFQVSVCTRGGNRSWSGVVKELDPHNFDYLFVLVADGRKWFIPSDQIGGRTALRLGGPKYARFEVDSAISVPQESQIAISRT
jgi:hypothetical protein